MFFTLLTRFLYFSPYSFNSPHGQATLNFPGAMIPTHSHLLWPPDTNDYPSGCVAGNENLPGSKPNSSTLSPSTIHGNPQFLLCQYFPFQKVHHHVLRPETQRLLPILTLYLQWKLKLYWCCLLALKSKKLLWAPCYYASETHSIGTSILVSILHVIMTHTDVQ